MRNLDLTLFEKNQIYTLNPSRLWSNINFMRWPTNLKITRFSSVIIVSISTMTHYLDESFLRTEKDYVKTYSKFHLDFFVEDTIFSKEFVMIYLIHT